MVPTFKTFDEWVKLGYKIKKGSKATWINEVAKFHQGQVEKRRSTWITKPTDWDIEEDHSEADYYGIDYYGEF